MISLQNHLVNTLVYLKDTLEQRDQELANRTRYFSVVKSEEMVKVETVNIEDCAKSTESDEKVDNIQTKPLKEN